MAYDSNKFNLMSQSIAGPRRWDYEDTGGETVAVYVGAGWFADAKDHGVDTGDHIIVRDRKNTIQYEAYFSAVQSTGATQGTIVLDTG